MQPCGIDSLPQWLLPCLSAMAVVSGIRLLRRPAVRQVLLISSPALGVTALAVFLILSSFSRQSWSDMVDLHIAGPPPSPTLVSWAWERRTEICRALAPDLSTPESR